MAAGDKGIPGELVEKAQCAVIVPGLKKGAFIVGGQFARASSPAEAAVIEDGPRPQLSRWKVEAWASRVGGSETDVILLVMNQRGADRLMQSEFTLGGEGEVAAGPVGRDASAQTDAKLSAEMLSWSRSRGVFAGIV